MTALTDHREGFHDGWNGAKRKTRRSIHYRHAFRNGAAARERQDNGGEDMPASKITNPRRKK